jgi:transposase-like protein
MRRAFAQWWDGGAIMDAKSFRRFCATLGSLTGPQLKELWTALRSLDARMQAIGAIEKRREGAVACPHCNHDKSTRWGSTRTGVQRLRCPSCRRTFSSSTGTAVARIHSPACFYQVVADMFCDHPRSCRGLGKALGLDKMTIWRWRQKIIRTLGGSGASDLGGVVEADEKFFRDSRKGSREWVRHQRDPINHPKPDRMRWVDYKRTRTKLPAGISKYQIPVLTMADRAGARRADVLPDHSAPPLLAVLARCLRSDAVLCSDRDPAYDFFARQNGVPHYRIDAKKGPFVIDKAFHVQTINSLHDRFERFMEPFRGPATKNLTGYASWFIDRSVRTQPERIEDAWDRLMAA